MTEQSARKVVIYGAGGHARVCVDVLREMPGMSVAAVVTDDGSGRADLGSEVQVAHSYLEDLSLRGLTTTFCVAIGATRRRQEITQKLTDSGHSITAAISRHAVIADSVGLGQGVQILPGAILMAETRVGHGVIVNTNASIDHDGRIGDYVHVAPGVAIAGDVTIGVRTLVGVGACIVPGVVVGSDVVIGAGAVVLRDVPDGVTVVGNPARVLRDGPADTRSHG